MVEEMSGCQSRRLASVWMLCESRAMFGSEISYVARPWGETHHYGLSGHRVDYKFGDSSETYSFDLIPGSFSLKSGVSRHRLFKAGLALAIIPLFALIVTMLKEGGLAQLSTALLFQIMLFAAGCILIVKFRKAYKAEMIMIGKEQALLILRDPANAEAADAYISAVRDIANVAEPKLPQ